PVLASENRKQKMLVIWGLRSAWCEAVPSQPSDRHFLCTDHAGPPRERSYAYHQGNTCCRPGRVRCRGIDRLGSPDGASRIPARAFTTRGVRVRANYDVSLVQGASALSKE